MSAWGEILVDIHHAISIPHSLHLLPPHSTRLNADVCYIRRNSLSIPFW